MLSVGQIVRQRREALGRTLAALAQEVGATKGYLSMIENQKLANPPSERILRGLERALSIADGELLRTAQWQRTPPPVKAQVRRFAAEAQAGQELAQWLKRAAGKRRDGTRNLDKLFRSGELGRRVDQTLKTAGGAGPTGGAAGKSEKPRMSMRGSGGRGGGVDSVVPVRYQVPLINRVAAGYPRDFTDLEYPARVADEYVGCPDLPDAQAFAARVVGDSMLPDYHEGDIVVFSPAAKVTDGCDCFVRLEPDHETTFKRIYFEGDGGRRLRLQPLNPRFAATTVDRRNVSGLYKAVWRLQRV